MSRKSVRRRIVPLDHTFFIPEGVDEFEYDKTQVIEPEEEDAFVVLEDVYLDAEDTEVEEDEVLLETPDNVTIVLQRIINGPGGQSVVELIIEVEDVDGAETYETKVTYL